MNLTTRNRITYALSLGVLALSGSAQAQIPSLFATFAQSFQIPDFKFDSSNSGASLGLASPLAVNFQFQTANGFGSSVGQGIPALMTMSAVSSGIAFTSTSFLVQPLKDIEMRFTSLGAPADSGDLLRVFLTTGNLLAQPGGQTANVSGTQSSTGTSIVNFDSDYLDFSQPLATKTFSVSFTSVEPRISQDGSGYLADFNATGTGNFSSAPAPPPRNRIPEPGTLVLAVLGGLALARRRKSVSA
ncbi:PEP-CTERM sorting domain-containing protein [Armatimonas sp.]|uniref:PEP-CTERM sorting domain-containing protein n=1 Tax=Armatimonas sp. TaxID=1872638 RepID=UPI0037537D11